MRDGGEITVQANGDYVWTSPTTVHLHRLAAHLLRRRRPAALHARQLCRGADRGRHRPVVHQLAHRRHSRDRHPDPDRRLRRLCAGLDAVPGPRADRRRGGRPAGRAAADVADPAAPPLQRHRRRLRHREQGLSRRLAGAHRLRPAARHLPVAQLHGRPAARDHGIGAHRRRHRTSRSSPPWCCR